MFKLFGMLHRKESHDCRIIADLEYFCKICNEFVHID